MEGAYISLMWKGIHITWVEGHTYQSCGGAYISLGWEGLTYHIGGGGLHISHMDGTYIPLGWRGLTYYFDSLSPIYYTLHRCLMVGH